MHHIGYDISIQVRSFYIDLQFMHHDHLRNSSTCIIGQIYSAMKHYYMILGSKHKLQNYSLLQPTTIQRDSITIQRVKV